MFCLGPLHQSQQDSYKLGCFYLLHSHYCLESSARIISSLLKNFTMLFLADLISHTRQQLTGLSPNTRGYPSGDWDRKNLKVILLEASSCSPCPPLEYHPAVQMTLDSSHTLPVKHTGQTTLTVYIRVIKFSPYLRVKGPQAVDHKCK